MLNDQPWNTSTERPLLETDITLLRSAIAGRMDESLPSLRQLAVVELAQFTGAKVHELAALNCGDVRLQKGHESIRIVSRTHPRVLPLDDEIAVFLGRYMAAKEKAGEEAGPSAPLVTSQRRTRLSIRGWQESWSMSQRLAGLVDDEGRPLFNLEGARALAGRRAYGFQGNPHHAQAWLGMEESTNVDRYSPRILAIDSRVLRSLLEKAGRIARDARQQTAGVDVAVSYYNGTAGIVDRHLCRRLLVNLPPEDVLGQFWIARCLHHGRAFFPINPVLAVRKASLIVREIVRMASSGHPMAMFLYASALNDGLGVSVDPEQSAHWFRKAAEAGFESAFKNYGLMLELGRGTQRDHEEAKAILERGAVRHEVSCMFNLASIHQKEGTRGGLNEALRWYRKAASMGDTRSMNRLSLLYRTGRGVPKDELLAERYYCLAGQTFPTVNGSNTPHQEAGTTRPVHMAG